MDRYPDPMDFPYASSREYNRVVQKGYKGLLSKARINKVSGLVDITGTCDGVCVQDNYESYVKYEKRLNAKEAIVSFLWGTWIVEKQKNWLPTSLY